MKLNLAQYTSCLLVLLWLAGPLAAHAQADQPAKALTTAIGSETTASGTEYAPAEEASAWRTVWLDSTASVQLPYASAQPLPAPSSPLVAYHTSTANNQFYALALTLEPEELPAPNRSSSPAIDQLLLDLLRRRLDFFAKPKFQVARAMALPASPERLATHRLYQGVDEFHQLPALLEMVWLLRDNHLYVMYCTYSLPQAPAAVAEVQQFFGSLAFAMGAP